MSGGGTVNRRLTKNKIKSYLLYLLIKVGGSLLRGTRGLLRGGLPRVVRVVCLGEWVRWCRTSIWPKSKPVGLAFDTSLASVPS